MPYKHIFRPVANTGLVIRRNVGPDTIIKAAFKTLCFISMEGLWVEEQVSKSEQSASPGAVHDDEMPKRSMNISFPF